MVAGMHDRLGSRGTGALFAIAAVLYLGLPVEALLGFPLDPARSYLSELAARDQPHSAVFRLTDGLGAVFILAGVALLTIRRTRRRLVACGAAALALFALATLADVIFPMECATSADPECARRDAEQTLGLSHQLHLASSVLALTAANVSVALLAVFATRARRTVGRARHLTMLVLAAMLLGSSLIMSVAALDGAADGVLPAGAGYVQRLQTASICLYLLAFPWTLAREARHPDPPVGALPDDQPARTGAFRTNEGSRTRPGAR
jgi:hypothetical protein